MKEPLPCPQCGDVVIAACDDNPYDVGFEVVCLNCYDIDYEPNEDGSPKSSCFVGRGPTKEAAIDDWNDYVADATYEEPLMEERKVVKLFSKSEPQKIVNPVVVQYLEELLVQARAGELAGLVSITHGHDGSLGHYVGMNKVANPTLLIGETSLVAQKLIAREVARRQ